LAWLFLLLTAVPFVELFLLLTMGKYTSVEFTLAFVILTGVLGAVLLRYQGSLPGGTCSATCGKVECQPIRCWMG
jgi:UPF0716 family protein affecting phage T7 exclusion